LHVIEKVLSAYPSLYYRENDDPHGQSAMLWVHCDIALKLILVIYGSFLSLKS